MDRYRFGSISETIMVTASAAANFGTSSTIAFHSGVAATVFRVIGTVKPKLRNDMIRRRSASWTWRRSRDLDFLYLFDGVYHRHVLAEVVFVELFRVFRLVIQNGDFHFPSESY